MAPRNRTKYQKEYRAKNKDKENARQRVRRVSYRFHTALSSSKSSAHKNGGISCTASVNELKEAFNGRCDICGIKEEECSLRLHMDHDHETGEFRGWLCGPCNRGLGQFKNSCELLIRATNYLQRSET